MATTIRTSWAELEIRSMVALSTKDLPVMRSVNLASITVWMARPARRQKRKRGSTESKLDFSKERIRGEELLREHKWRAHHIPSQHHQRDKGGVEHEAVERLDTNGLLPRRRARTRAVVVRRCGRALELE